jgi:DNA-binding HxlR family transcriptional regulator
MVVITLIWYYALFEFNVYICSFKSAIMKELDLQFPTCPIRNVLGRFADKWSLLILCSLQAQGKLRYTEIRNAVPDISQKMLTGTLKQLEKDHLLKRKAYAEIPPRVEYSLTELGMSLMPIIGQMIEWAQVHFEEVTK